MLTLSQRAEEEEEEFVGLKTLHEVIELLRHAEATQSFETRAKFIRESIDHLTDLLQPISSADNVMVRKIYERKGIVQAARYYREKSGENLAEAYAAVKQAAAANNWIKPCSPTSTP